MNSFPPSSTSTRTTAFLADLATACRDPAVRHAYVADNPDFPAWLSDVVQRIVKPDGERRERIELLKVVANFVAEDDDNRTIICERTSSLTLIDVLFDEFTTSKLDYDLIKPLLASTLNLVLSPSYPIPRTHFLQNSTWTRIVILANRVYRPCETNHESLPGTEERATLASWAWKAVSAIVETAFANPESEVEFVLPPCTIDHLTAPLEYFSRPLGSTDDVDRGVGTMVEDLEILASSTTVLHLLSTTTFGVNALIQAINYNAPDPSEAGRRLVGFVEYGDVIDGWTEDPDPDSDDDEIPSNPPAAGTDTRPGGKALGTAKASIMASLAELCASTQLELFDRQMEGRWFWDVLVRWVGSLTMVQEGKEGRDDLASCGLLCIGNYIKDDKTAHQIASQPRLIAHLIDLLDAATPATTPQLLHALLGALRNLVLAPERDLKQKLAPHVVSAVRRMQVFDAGRDLLGSVQGGAVGLLRMLCRGDEYIARTVAAETELLSQIMDLWTRCDDQAIKIEISRFVAALCTAIARGLPQPTPVASETNQTLDSVLQDQRTVRALTMLLALGPQQEIILAEGVLALALVAKSVQGARAVLDVLEDADDKSLAALKAYAATPTAPIPVLSNICVLFLNLAEGHAESDGVSVQEGRKEEERGQFRTMVVDALRTISEREDMNDSLRLVVQSAQRAWEDVP